MVPQADEVYFRRRAEQELELAQSATDRAVVRAHYRLAEAYLDKLEPGAHPAVRDATPVDKPLFNFAAARTAAS